MNRSVVNSILVSLAAVAVSYAVTWDRERPFNGRRLLIMAVITFVAAYIADYLGDKLINRVDPLTVT